MFCACVCLYNYFFVIVTLTNIRKMLFRNKKFKLILILEIPYVFVTLRGISDNVWQTNWGDQLIHELIKKEKKNCIQKNFGFFVCV